MPGHWKPTHEKVHECVLVTRHDAFLFSEALREAFPRIRFLSADYERKFFDFRAWKAALDEADRDGRPRPHRLDFTRDAKGKLPDYFPSLGDVLEKNFVIWVEPPNWRPRWQRSKKYDRLYLANEPRLHFNFWRGGFSCPDVRRTLPLEGNPEPNVRDLTDPPFPLDANENIYLEGQRMTASWAKGDESARKFVQKVWRILDKTSTNRLIAIEPRTREPYPSEGPPQGEAYLRAARHALDWARARRHNYLRWGATLYKPLGYFDKREAEPRRKSAAKVRKPAKR